MSEQVTFITVHKGIDLHAATALRVMQDRLQDGDSLVALARAEFHTHWSGESGPGLEQLLANGRYFNPNKHHFGHFLLMAGGAPWFADSSDGTLPAGWPGIPQGTDLSDSDSSLYDRLLGVTMPISCAAVDVCAYPLGESGPLLSGVLWRLFLNENAGDVVNVARSLAITRSGREGLLVNPHMQGWRLAEAERHTLRGAGA